MKHALSKSKSERNCWFTCHKFKAPVCCLPLHKVGVWGDKLEFKEIVGRLLTCTESQHYLVLFMNTIITIQKNCQKALDIEILN